MSNQQQKSTGSDAPTCSAILSTLDVLSRRADKKLENDEFARKSMVQYSATTMEIAKTAGVSLSVTRYHLTSMWKSGKIDRNKFYVGCCATWYLPQNSRIDRPVE